MRVAGSCPAGPGPEVGQGVTSLAASAGEARPWPLAPLLELAGWPARTVASIAERAGVPARSLGRLLEVGATDAQADNLATALGFHPSQVWPDWFAVDPAAEMVVVPDGRVALVLSPEVATAAAEVLDRAGVAELDRGVLPDEDLAELAGVLRGVAAAGGLGWFRKRNQGCHGRVVWLGVHEAAVAEGVTPRAIRKRAERGQIPGAHLVGHRWLIPHTKRGATQ